MKDDIHTVWLMMGEADQRTFEAVLADLAARLDGPAFAPHATLLGDSGLPRDRLVAMLRATAMAVPAFTQPIVAIETGPSFFRSLYARFDIGPELAALKLALDPDNAGSFMPHVSLYYGTGESAEKHAAASGLAALTGRQVVFDHICLVRSAQALPIAEWRILESFPLGGAG